MGFDERDGYTDGKTGKPGFLLVEEGGDYSDSHLDIVLKKVKPETSPLLFTGVQYNKEDNTTTYFFAYEPLLAECNISRGRIIPIPLMEVKEKRGKRYIVLPNSKVKIENLFEVSGLEAIIDKSGKIKDIDWQPIVSSEGI